jgi:hypothetical protein
MRTNPSEASRSQHIYCYIWTYNQERYKQALKRWIGGSWFVLFIGLKKVKRLLSFDEN